MGKYWKVGRLFGSFKAGNFQDSSEKKNPPTPGT